MSKDVFCSFRHWIAAQTICKLICASDFCALLTWAMKFQLWIRGGDDDEVSGEITESFSRLPLIHSLAALAIFKLVSNDGRFKYIGNGFWLVGMFFIKITSQKWMLGELLSNKSLDWNENTSIQLPLDIFSELPKEPYIFSGLIIGKPE